MNAVAALLELLLPVMIARTCTVPAACAGETAVHVVDDEHATGVAFAVPNLVVPPVPIPSPSPVTVTVVPPAVVPAEGLRAVITGVNV